jgi:hypothetical protein
MTTIWKSGDQKTTKQATNNNSISGTTFSSCSRQQKLAMATITGAAILGLFLAMSACSKQSPKPALSGVSSPSTRRDAHSCTNTRKRRSSTHTRKEDAQEAPRECHLQRR